MENTFKLWDWDRHKWVSHEANMNDYVELNWFISGDRKGEIFVCSKEHVNVQIIFKNENNEFIPPE